MTLSDSWNLEVNLTNSHGHWCSAAALWRKQIQLQQQRQLWSFLWWTINPVN